MPRPKPLRKKHQGINFVLGALRKLALDPKVAAYIRLRAIDRVAKIDDIYDTPLYDTSGYLPRGRSNQTDVEKEQDEESDLDRHVREILENERKSTAAKNSVPTNREEGDDSVR